MKDFLYKLTDFVRDEGGRLSSMRLLFLAWGFAALAMWIFVSIKTVALAPLSLSLTSFIISLVGGKVLQSYTETQAPVPSITVTTTAPTVITGSLGDTVATGSIVQMP